MLMVPFVDDDFLRVAKRVLLLVLKPEVVNPCTSISALKNLNEKANFVKAKDI